MYIIIDVFRIIVPCEYDRSKTKKKSMSMKVTDESHQYLKGQFGSFHCEIVNDRRKALSSMYDLYYESLLRYGLKILPDHVTVEDSIQELFMYIWEHNGCLENVTSVESYLLSALRHRIFRQVKAQKAIHHRNRVYIENCLPDESSHDFEKTDKEALFRSAVTILSGRQKEMIKLKYFEGLSTKEIASFLGIKR
ncbi:MAG TPA: sigma-70 family RNA polymerase sigma factor, partial [Balneolales bacterium]|nr:sigma-70 family RNA polymerase sigma factor [Balneolales bacterium]